MKRSTPLKRATPLRSKPSTLSKARRLRQEVLSRDGSCRALSFGVCECRACFPACHGRLDAAHVFPRRDFAAKDRYNEDACALMCRRHHRMYDNREPTVTVPIQHLERARKLLAGARTAPTSKRTPPRKGSK